MADQHQTRRPRRGIAAVAVIVILVIVDLVVVGVVLSESRGHDVTVQRLETVRAYYAAEAGMHMALRELMLQDNLDDDCAVGTISNDGIDANDPALGTASFMVTAAPSGSQYIVRSHGRSGDARREMSALVGVTLGGGQIELDAAVGNGAATWTGSMTTAHTIGGGSDRLFVVTVSTQGATDGDWDIVSITYDGKPMTKAVDHVIVEAVPMNIWLNHEIWYMLEADLPPAGSYLLTITPGGFGAWVNASWMSVTGAAQEPPEATATGEFWGGYGITTDITTLTDNAWVFEAVGQRTSGCIYTPQVGQVVRMAFGSIHSGNHLTDEIPTAGTTSQSTTSSNPQPLCHVLAAFAPK
jgi:Tfp pilus assembly protein PilX